MKTTTAKPAATADEVVRLVSTDIVHVSVQNTRQPTEKEVTASGLVESIKNQGQLTPGLARPHPTIEDHLELAAGACRLVSCQKLGLSYRVIVRPMTDAELLDAILTENLQRTDPDPEAEAELIKIRLAEGMTPGEICAKYGKAEVWVKRRMKILSISPKVRKLMKSGGHLAHFTTEMKERVGDMDKAVQERLMGEWPFKQAKTVEDLTRCVRGISCSLEGQEWINDPDTAVKDCGPGCANNDANTLFPDPHTKNSCGNCLNTGCFKQRKALAQEKAIRVALGDTKVGEVVFFSEDYNSGIFYDGKSYKALDRWDFKDFFTISKKPTSRIGLDVTDPLKVKRVYLEATAKGKAKPNTGSAAGAKESREDKLTGKRLAVINKLLVDYLPKSPLPAGVPILHIVAAFGLCRSRSHCNAQREHTEAWTSLDADACENVTTFSMSDNSKKPREEALWAAVWPVLHTRLFFNKNSDLLPKWMQDEMRRIAQLTSFDYEAEWTKICTELLPVPKSWGPGIDAMTLKPAGGVKAAAPAKKAAKKTTKKAAKVA